MDKCEPIEPSLVVSRDCRALAVQVINTTVDAMNRAKKEPVLFEAALLFLVRVTNAMQSIEILAQAGMNADATGVMRTVVEHDINLAYILKEDTERRLRLFFAYELVREKLEADAINELHGGTVDAAAMAAIQKNFDEVKADFPDLYNWAGKDSSTGKTISIGKRAAATGRGNYYKLAYAEGCGASHSGAEGLRHVYSTTEDALGKTVEMAFHLGGQKPSGRAIGLALVSYLSLLGLVIGVCRLKQFEQAQEQLFERLKGIS